MAAGSASGIRLRDLERSDLESVLELVRPEVPELVLEPDDLRANLFEDPGADRGTHLAAEEGCRLAGVACGVLRGGPGGTGHLKLLVVEPSRRRRGTGSLLHDELVRRLAGRGAARVATDGAAPVYLLPGLPERAAGGRRFLERRGYRAVEERASLTADLRGLDLETGPLEARLGPGFAVRRAAPADRDLLDREVAGLFSSDWAFEAVASLRRARPGVHLALHEGRLAGFAAAGVWARNAFGPMGTAPAFEGRGIGEILLKRCLRDLRDAGQRTATIAWIGPEEFYRRKAGAETTLRYVVMERPCA
ncbi:MAG: GNAT family N-acetyltransferase [Planctomycetes bacterium]|nr:GNAT family N-acetyltransferase [Planctomycetota bacterium]